MCVGATALLMFASLPAYAEKLPPNQRTYTNQDYGFSVDLPQGLQACVTTPPGSNHGVVVALDSVDDCDRIDDSAPRIYINAEFNVAYEAKTPFELAKIECAHNHPRHVRVLRHLELAGKDASSCRLEGVDGSLEYKIFAFRGMEGEIFSWIIVSAELDTTRKRYAADIARFRAMLRTIRLNVRILP